jgi:hypothetical protein
MKVGGTGRKGKGRRGGITLFNRVQAEGNDEKVVFWS